MFTPPEDLPSLGAGLEAGWSLRAATLEYRPVGFGSHHWELVDTAGVRWFITVDDLRTRRFHPGEPLTACYDRLRASLGAAQALQAGGCGFVVAPRSDHNGEPLVRLGDSFTMSVYPFITGESFGWGDHTPSVRRATLDLVVGVHTAPPSARGGARPDDYVIQSRERLTAGPGDPGAGPFARPAGELLKTHDLGVRRALRRYDDLVAAVHDDPPAQVLTHGEPHPGNVMRTGDGWLLIDWDTALLAPPERDLWDLDPGDGTVHAAYTKVTGTALRPALLELYRLRWDLTDIAVGLARFSEPHGDTADDRETWTILGELIPKAAGL